MSIRLEVTTLPKFTTEELAIQLANSLQGASEAQSDTIVYNEQIRTDKQKLIKLNLFIRKVVDFRNNPPKFISRMEPMMGYDLEEMERELELTENRINKWKKMIGSFSDKLKQDQKDALRLQKEIQDRKLIK